MASTEPVRPSGSTQDPTAGFPTRHLPAPAVADLPPAPDRTWRYVGPGIVAAGVGLSSGEFILFPYIASQVGLAFVWAALLGLITQYFLNWEFPQVNTLNGRTGSAWGPPWPVPAR